MQFLEGKHRCHSGPPGETREIWQAQLGLESGVPRALQALAWAAQSWSMCHSRPPHLSPSRCAQTRAWLPLVPSVRPAAGTPGCGNQATVGGNWFRPRKTSTQDATFAGRLSYQGLDLGSPPPELREARATVHPQRWV